MGQGGDSVLPVALSPIRGHGGSLLVYADQMASEECFLEVLRAGCQQIRGHGIDASPSSANHYVSIGRWVGSGGGGEGG